MEGLFISPKFFAELEKNSESEPFSVCRGMWTYRTAI